MYSLFGAAAGVIVLLVLGIGVVSFVAWCQLLKKADRNWWGMFIPYYSTYLQYEVAGMPGTLWIIIAMNILTLVLRTPALLTINGIAMVIIHIVHSINLARSFGRSGGFACGLIFLFPIFLIILGFGSAEYEGV